MDLPIIDKFELHYYFTDDSHTMNAFVQSKCETELLALINELVQTFDVKLEVETEPYSNGSLKRIWKLLGKNQTQINLILTVLNIMISIWPKSSSKLEQLQEEQLKLEIEEKKINLQRLKINAKEQVPTNYKNLLNDSVDVISTNLKVIKHRSNFYTNINNYPKVTQISTTLLNNDNQIVEEVRMVNRSDFHKFIIETDELPASVDDKAVISIIAPVLKKGKYKWRGYYQNQAIEFYMKDEAFKDSIVQQKVSFKNGVSIQCVLEVTKKLNELGYEQVTNYNVLTVLSVEEGNTTQETEQGKHYHKVKEAEKLQYKLNFK